MRIGIDIMGGDYAPRKTIHGAVLALNELPKETTVVLVGKKSEILAELKHLNYSADIFEIIDCSEVIDMGEHPIRAFKSKSNSSKKPKHNLLSSILMVCLVFLIFMKCFINDDFNHWPAESNIEKDGEYIMPSPISGCLIKLMSIAFPMSSIYQLPGKKFFFFMLIS